MGEDRVLKLGAHAHASQAELAFELVELHRGGEWRGHGIRSFGHWCDINLGIDSRQASRLVAAAARLEDLPLLREAFIQGSLSTDKLVLVAEVASPQSDRKFRDIALAASLAQLRRICSEYRKLLNPDSPDQAKERHARRGVSVSSTDCGLVRLAAVLEPDEAAIVLAALDARAETAWRVANPSKDSPAPDLSTRRATAMVELATEGLVQGPEPVVAGEKIEVRVIVDVEVLSGEREDGICCIEGIGAIPRPTAERLLCDATIAIAKRLDDGSLNIGRASYEPNRRQRRALRFRDKGCRYPGCANRRFVQIHHVTEWELGGRTDMDNLLLLCPEHHRLFHEGGYTITSHGGGRFSFHRPDGRTLGPPPLRAGPAAGPPAPGNPRAQGGGERYDLDLTITALTS